ncbi:MAG: hypothetical protein COV70_04090 [Parcubacteria group bacterium CG11_big_fil_rev_8_21_14_0_20_39_22]|nr:MAG: hypothetical protein COV70_04090 [Parcubacteria group bacterium CG11_big_fil_rev_8_21_14_0_20_39_22]
MNKAEGRKGLVKTIILIVIAIFIIAYFGFDLKEFFASERFQTAFDKTKEYIVIAWDFTWDITKTSSLWVWHNIIIAIIWNKAIVPVTVIVKGWM